MQEDEPINYKAELNKKINKLVDLRSRYDELKEDYNYIKSLNNKHFDEKIKLEKENEQLKQSYKEFEDECQSTFNAMSRKQDDLYRKNFKLKEENEQLKQQIEDLEFNLQEVRKMVMWND